MEWYWQVIEVAELERGKGQTSVTKFQWEGKKGELPPCGSPTHCEGPGYS